jgi:hypothetical protein
MKLPDKVEIFGITFQVQNVAVINDDTNQLGEITHKDQTIRVKSDLGDDMKTQVLLHEILHGIDESLGNPLGDTPDDAERLVQSLSAALHQTLKGHLAFS